jgi:uncharacterized membrane protein YdfJ with MMPL/SSD domain
MERLFAALGRLVVQFKYPVAIAWILITIVCVRVFPSLSSVARDTNSSFLPGNTPSVQAQALAGAFQNTNARSLTIVAARGRAPLTPADQAAILRLEQAVRALSHVTLVRDEGVSPDGEARQILVQATVPANGTGASRTFVDNVRHRFSTVGAPPGLALHAAGELPIQVDTQSQSSNSRSNTQAPSFIFILVLLLIAFRALLAPLVTLLPAALVLALSSPVIAASTRIGVQVSSITQIILIVLVLGAGTDYGLFLVFRVREELRNGREPHDAVIRSLTHVGETISFSAFTVIAALLCLLALVLRSVVAPLYLVVSVLLSFLAALGFAAIVFVHLGPDSGLNFVLPFVMFVFLMALGSDYNILVMTRIREEAHRLPLGRAVLRAVGISGGTITTAGVILAGTFAVLGLAAGNGAGADQTRQIGYGIAAGVIMDTFLIRTMLVPAMVVLLGRWNWWPSTLFRGEERRKEP